MEQNGFVDNLLYGPPPGTVGTVGYHSIGLIDIVLALALLFLYFRMPVRSIDRTCDEMYAYPAYGGDPAAWRAKMIRRYWMGCLIVPSLLIWWGILGAKEAADFLKAFLIIWPLVIAAQSVKERQCIHATREQDVEDRIAAGLATKSDMAYYLKSMKEKEYWRGYWDGRR